MRKPTFKKNAFQKVVDHFGGVPQMAAALGVTRQAVSQWGERFPEGRAFQIEVLTNGKFKAKDLPLAEKRAA